MKNLFEASAVDEVLGRMAQLHPDSERQWGKMNAAQMMAHVSGQFEMIAGKSFPPRGLAGRIFGRFAKPIVTNDKPFRQNTPTDKNLVIDDERDFEAERQRLRTSIECFQAGGPAGCTRHPHSFFGPLTPTEWATLMYKHLDHHLRQFGV